jgi:hypothetical protein
LLLFAELKNQIGLRRLRLRRLKFVREQFFLAAAAQNINGTEEGFPRCRATGEIATRYGRVSHDTRRT